MDGRINKFRHHPDIHGYGMTRGCNMCDLSKESAKQMFSIMDSRPWESR